MKKSQRPLFKAAAAAVGVCALTLGGVALPAFAEKPVLDAGAASLSTADKYELAAAQIDSSVDELKLAEEAGELGVSEGGHVYFIDPAHGSHDALTLEVAVQAAAIPGNPSAGSLPGAPVTIYLDFDGAVVTGTGWNDEQGEATMTFSPASAADAEFQRLVWASVAEDYAPFNINVTTTNPGDAALYKTSADDNQYGVHVVVTDSYDDVLSVAAGTGGIAYVGAVGAEFLAPAFVFTEGTGNNAKSVAESAAHEAGHNFGLSHDGIGSEEYYSAEAGIWGPIMGASYVPPLTQWSNGDYAAATSTQDDVAEIVNRSAASYTTNRVLIYADGTPYVGPVCSYNGSDPSEPTIDDQFQVPGADNLCDNTGAIVSFQLFYTDRADYRGDTVGNTTATATALDNSSGTFTANNVIITRDDVDVYSFTTDGGTVDATVTVADVAPNLDTKLTLSDSAGTEVTSDSPATSVAGDGTAAGLGASISVAELPAGTYYLTVDGVGQGDNQSVTPKEANGYSDYGSLGNYKLTGNASAPTALPDAPVITAPANGASIDSVTFLGTGTAGAEVTVTYGVAGGTSQTGAATVGADGSWIFTPVTPLAEGEYTVTATQTVDGVLSPVSNTVVFSIVSSGGGTPGGSSDAGGGTAGGTADGSGDGHLPNTGSDNSLAGLGIGAIALLLIGAGVVAVAARQRKLSVEA